ncbi:MAG: iron-containing redox enzyme family protein [Deltaproteobacteria bacterium]|nr:iron-containing redox enzyme family protein [Deltaproteobacteria bacterium]
METHIAESNGVEGVWHELVELVNRQFETPPFRRLLDLRFNQARAQALSIQMKHYVANRRDCWGFVAGAAPLSVKRLIWEHEGEELMGDKAAGKVDHITLAVQEGRIFGLSPEDYERVRPLDAAVACFYAWIHLAKDRPWREAVAASAVLEMRNSDELVRDGSLSYRVGKNLERDLGIPLKRQINNAEHVTADIEHGQLLLAVAREHCHTEEDQQALLRGARESLVIDRAYREQLVNMMEALD